MVARLLIIRWRKEEEEDTEEKYFHFGWRAATDQNRDNGTAARLIK
ncbi:Uncharacterized protein APZ42_026075 [Daphnia magna]|uniref:Uncharacterized protein n=1 Tax=Daphnia magna TaxID=35525 RepID=A0A164SIN8_9CRUS|nr:Uncharacterized protein APZ42_026075 [Daphnia magna]